MRHLRLNRALTALALCGAWGCAQIAGLTGEYSEGAAGAAASGGVAEGQAGDTATAGHGMSQNGKGGSSSGHGGGSGGLNADAGNNQTSAGEAGMSEVGGGLSSGGASAGNSGSSAGKGGASSGSGGSLGGGPSGGAASGGAASGGAASGGAASGGAASGGAANSGDCNGDADCAGGKCVSLSPGGFRTCQVVVPLATTCDSGSDECCTDGTLPCVTGRCVRGPLDPHCGGALPVSANVCATLGCTTNADCADNETCILAGTLDHLSNSCVPGGCRLDSDCKAAAGGKCESVTPNCCAGALGLYCVYPTGGCRKNDDCPGGHCYIGADNVTAACVTGNGFCPG